MAAVHTIEVAEGDDRRTEVAGEGVEAGPGAHDDPL